MRDPGCHNQNLSSTPPQQAQTATHIARDPSRNLGSPARKTPGRTTFESAVKRALSLGSRSRSRGRPLRGQWGRSMNHSTHGRAAIPPSGFSHAPLARAAVGLAATLTACGGTAAARTVPASTTPSTLSGSPTPASSQEQQQRAASGTAARDRVAGAKFFLALQVPDPTNLSPALQT